MNRLTWSACALILTAVILEGSHGHLGDPQAMAPVTALTTYRLDAVARLLTEPVGLAVAQNGDLYVAEAGRIGGSTPRVIRISKGQQQVVVASDFPAPLTGLTWDGPRLVVTHVGGINLLDPKTGAHHPIVSGLPGQGDYPNGAVAVGPDGSYYFAIGTATNSGVIGDDNVQNGWVETSPAARDIPCKTLTVRGNNFTIPNSLTVEPTDLVTTGAFSAFGKTTGRLQVLKGSIPCTGAVLNAKPDGTDLKLVAWGLRYPSGLAFGPDSELYTIMHGYEDRGSRPILADVDYLYRIEVGRWYGWPDFAGGRSVTDEEFQRPSFAVTPLLVDPPEQPPQPVATFEGDSNPAAIIFPPESFGLRGDALVALSSRSIVRVNPRSGTVTPIALQSSDLLHTPTNFATGPRGQLYLVDAGMSRTNASGSELVAGSGAVLLLTVGDRSATALPRSSAHRIDWQLTLIGAVVSVAGVRLVRRPEE